MSELPLRLVGRDPARAVELPTRVCLAPMEGVTERVFRELVIAEGGVGMACTEFLRVGSAGPVPEHLIARDWRSGGTCPVAVQFMAAEPNHLAVSIGHAEAVGAPCIDLNFGCPAPRVFSHCAGSALLAHPQRLASLVRTAVAATTLPVTAKIRAGISDSRDLEDIVAAIIDAGAAALCVHGRLRTQGYHEAATWDWIRRVVAVRDRLRPDMPIIGNGGVDVAGDITRMRRETGCDVVMIGRAALANPWIFREYAGGPVASPGEVLRFAVAYGEGLRDICGAHRAAARLKQFIKFVRAAGLFADEDQARRELLRSEGDTALAMLRAGFTAAAARADARSASEPAAAVQ